LFQITWDAVARRIPASRIFVPAIITLELFRLAEGYSSRTAMMIAIAACELSLAAVVVIYLKLVAPELHAQLEPEQRVSLVLSRFIPEDLSRWIACELFL